MRPGEIAGRHDCRLAIPRWAVSVAALAMPTHGCTPLPAGVAYPSLTPPVVRVSFVYVETDNGPACGLTIDERTANEKGDRRRLRGLIIGVGGVPNADQPRIRVSAQFERGDAVFLNDLLFSQWVVNLRFVRFGLLAPGPDKSIVPKERTVQRLRLSGPFFTGNATDLLDAMDLSLGQGTLVIGYQVAPLRLNGQYRGERDEWTVPPLTTDQQRQSLADFRECVVKHFPAAEPTQPPSR